MTQEHPTQEGLFHITTNAKDKSPWLTLPGVPEIIIHDLLHARNLHGAHLYAFCVLPTHMHFMMGIETVPLSEFVRSFKTNTSRNIRRFLFNSDGHVTVAGKNMDNNNLLLLKKLDKNEMVFTGWQHSFHSHPIEGDLTRSNILRYIQYNAFRHQLVDEPDAWPWSSLKYEDDLDSLDW